MVISLPLAPVVPPLITSPLVNVPLMFVKVKVGAAASALVLSESKTATRLKKS